MLPLLFLPSEAFATEDTAEWQVITVNMHMCSDISFINFFIITMLTFNRLRRVGFQMSF